MIIKKWVTLLDWKLPPPSNCGKYKLIATDKVNDDIYLLLLGDDLGAKKLKLREVLNGSCTKLQEYIKMLLTDIVQGKYDLHLIDPK